MILDNEYKIWIKSLKDKIRSAQLKAAVAVNVEMIILYWEIGKSIVDAQSTQLWGSKVIEQMAKDLKLDLPDTNGFSRTNLFSMRKFYLFYKDSQLVHQAGGLIQNTDIQSDTIVRQASGLEKNGLVQQVAGLITEQNILCKIPWRHHISIIGKCDKPEQAIFYIEQTIQNNWSRNVLEIQLETKLINRQGKSQNKLSLPCLSPKVT